MEVTIIKFRFWGILISLCIIQTLQLFFMDAWAQSNSTDSVTNFIEQTADGFEFDNISNDSLFNKSTILIEDSILSDSLTKDIETPIIAQLPDTLHKPKALKQWVPNPTRATWLAVVFPGAGQIYNRKYWKLPIFYGGFAGCAYALTWNNNMYKDYSKAYRDLMSDDPNKNSYEELLPPNHGYSKSQLESVLKNRKDRFRRYRDLSIFAFIGVYVLSIIDAYVDAELSNFDISPDLSMRIEPAILNNQQNFSTTSRKSVGVQCSFTF
ncbi:MAG: DUF5683 domain-containing protein [Bacteroides sp.]|nr:DUF5683 domain-containing protein [Bacteroides sp.]MDD2645117.1 DUF5683 domain-containing protein [Bacteroides sp.]MDD4054442.1 DUF5683 domain-containing protein [Bacteroides sp.]MDD4719564.1 DUF5683 domain-containing protein [Bacteroides sp.]NLI64244.1 hypothetical protein [Bacteroidales bacterium]